MIMSPLKSVAHVRNQACAGFTLLEVVIAAGLSIVVVLLAYSAIRMAGKAVSSMERASVQGSMLRTSFIVVSEGTRLKADMASPAPPLPAVALDLSITDRPKTWPDATFEVVGKSNARVRLKNQITGIESTIDLAMTGARDVP